MVIERIEIFITELPTRIQRTFSSGSYDTGASKDALGKPVLVKLHADGVTGYGQIRAISPGHFVADTVHSMVAAIRDIYGPLLKNRKLGDFEGAHQAFDSRLAGNPAARAVLDIALHDAWGKALGVPVHQLLGGCCQPQLPIEWSVSFSDDVSVMIEEARRAVEEYGIKVLCLKAAGPQGWRRDVRNFEAVRNALGFDVVIGVDPNTGWSYSDTIAFMEAVRPLDLGYLEQPTGRREIATLAAIRDKAAGVPVMADESLFTIEDAFQLAQGRAVDVFCIKLYKVGGLTPARKISAIAEAASVKLNSGGLAVQSQLEAAASAHFCASIPATRMFGAAEFAFALGGAGRDPLVGEPAMELVDGMVTVPTGLGLGVIIDEDALERHTIHRTEIRL